ncbi:hypothetical protein SanaruYs_05790 [Chryseotalea sanaruensis]|uniref:Uncharacterized protein n=1 Tax=Chryseotalea sanaruensis TaxID=2482724 RepID=A0A401U5Y0_9BACT|nr:hypothetical protein [Chryseotalea sanaruensis]GCC50364.1 hypothetical protein SanaruYs_05790 [Chryseotalea sanaruensis]
MKIEVLERIFSEKKGSCLSIIIPQHTLSRERMLNVEIYRKAIRKAKSLLKRKENDPVIIETMLAKLESLNNAFNPDVALNGIGLFISKNIAERVNFPFAVKEKIIVDSSFETRDLYYLRQLMTPYYIVALTKKSVHLYLAQGEDLTEIKDGQFPMQYQEEYEYERASFGTSFGFSQKGFEKDKRTGIKSRIDLFFKKAAEQLTPYVEKNHHPLILAGTKEMIAEFKSQSVLPKKIDGEIIGPFKEDELYRLRTKAYASLIKHQKLEINAKINDFIEKDTVKHLAKGIQEVWQAAHQGRGLTLLVEKDYKQISYLRESDPSLYLRAPKGKYTLVPDAVDEIIETVLEKGGHVFFTEDNKLRSFNSIALLLRY